jgi:hypothetical protein
MDVVWGFAMQWSIDPVEENLFISMSRVWVTGTG